MKGKILLKGKKMLRVIFCNGMSGNYKINYSRKGYRFWI